MRTLGSLSRERQERIALETIEIYAPIAHRLGMGKIRGELEDLAFLYLEPEASAEFVKQFEATRASDQAFLDEVKHLVEVNLAREGIPARVEGRLKRPYSVFQKLKRQKIAIDQVYDLAAVRIITDSVKNCYAALGVIHNEWHPIPGRIKDFIAIPRPNLYQSLHTSVMGPEGRHFEVQIAPTKCTASPRKASRRTGNTKKASAGPWMTISASPGCASWSSGSAKCAIPRSSCPRSKWTCTRRKSTRSRPRVA
jgi:GTP pyrophosphokinase